MFYLLTKDRNGHNVGIWRFQCFVPDVEKENQGQKKLSVRNVPQVIRFQLPVGGVESLGEKWNVIESILPGAEPVRMLIRENVARNISIGVCA